MKLLQGEFAVVGWSIYRLGNVELVIGVQKGRHESGIVRETLIKGDTTVFHACLCYTMLLNTLLQE
jgi:hypothetical protein